MEALLGNDVESGSSFKITLDGNKVEEIEYTPEDGKKKMCIRDSLYTTGSQPEITDSLITLSTCLGKGKRVIVHAVLLLSLIHI